jgi:hypothetical protein
MFCPKCKAEYREGFFKCADCKIDLVPELEPELPPEPETYVEYVNLVNIETYSYRHEADLVKGLLSTNGIDAVVKDGIEAAGGAAPIYGLLVKEEDCEEAKKLLSELPSEPGTYVEYDDLVNIETCSDRPEAEVAKNFLSANGIYAVIQGGEDSACGDLALLSGVQLLVKEEDVEEAKKFLSEIEK